MAFIYNMKVSRKLLMGFIIVALLVGMVGIVGITKINEVNENDTYLYEKMTVPTSLTSQISTSFHRMRVNIRQTIIYENIFNKQVEAEYARDRLDEISTLSQELGVLIESDKLMAIYSDLEKARSEMEPLVLKALREADLGHDNAVWLSVQNGSPLGNASADLQKAIDDLNSALMDEGLITSENNVGITKNSVSVMMIIIAVSALIAIALALFLSKQIGAPLIYLTDVAKKLAVGDVDVNVKQKSQDEIGQLMGAIRGIVDNIKEQSDHAEEIAKGNLDIEIIPKSDKDVLSIGMKTVIESLSSLVDEAAFLTEKAIEGRLETRGDASKYQGGYRQIVVGVNEMLDAIVDPINTSLEFIAGLADGSVSEMIPNEESYKGYYKELIKNLNDVLKALFMMVSETDQVIDEALKGNLKFRADSSKLNGGFARLVEGVNNTLDAVIKPVNEAADVLDEMAKGNMKARVTGDYQGDHAAIKEALNFMGETIGDYLDEIAGNLTKMANKDFTVSISREYLGDFILLKDSINNINDQFNEVLKEINSAAEQVEVAAEQVAASSQALSQGSAEQASSVEEISSSMTEVAEQTKQNAVNANEANVLSNNAKNDATKGNAQMADMLVAMNDIKDSSKNIANIIKVIDDIAFQTNILALNAAVEAARAGEHGKGFAVVAEEVRNLAARSASAAKETTEMIDNSINKVNDGYEMANSTASALGEIVGGVTNSVDIVGMIADASNEQASAITQINEGVDQISQVTQTNMATAEESASASEELASHAMLLKQLIDEFKLRGNGNAKKKFSKAVKNNPIKRSDFSSEVEITLEDNAFGKY